MCEVQRSASEIRRAPVQIGLTGTLTVSTKVQSYQVEKGFRNRENDFLRGEPLKSKRTVRAVDSDQVETDRPLA